MIEKCIKWQEGLCLGDRTNLYIVLLTNGRVYIYNKCNGWTRRNDIHVGGQEDGPWRSCTPLEVIVVCGTRGLE